MVYLSFGLAGICVFSVALSAKHDGVSWQNWLRVSFTIHTFIRQKGTAFRKSLLSFCVVVDSVVVFWAPTGFYHLSVGSFTSCSCQEVEYFLSHNALVGRTCVEDAVTLQFETTTLWWCHLSEKCYAESRWPRNCMLTFDMTWSERVNSEAKEWLLGICNWLPGNVGITVQTASYDGHDCLFLVRFASFAFVCLRFAVLWTLAYGVFHFAHFFLDTTRSQRWWNNIP